MSESRVRENRTHGSMRRREAPHASRQRRAALAASRRPYGAAVAPRCLVWIEGGGRGERLPGRREVRGWSAEALVVVGKRRAARRAAGGGAGHRGTRGYSRSPGAGTPARPSPATAPQVETATGPGGRI